jgi:ubiquinone/menaquinone biosynthesis C-methylase UbiE
MLTVDFKRLGIGQGDRIVDIGCGEGRHTIEAGRQQDSLCLGADYLFDNLVTTREKVRFHQSIKDISCKSMDFSCMDAAQLPFKDQSFDAVICSEVLEHIPNDKKAAAELWRVLKPGKVLALSVPRFWPEKICWALSGEYTAAAMGHLRIYKKKKIIQLFESLGMKCFYSHYAHSIHVPYWWLKCLMGINRTDSIPVNLYHRLLVWDLMSHPPVTAFIDRLFNPVLGKSLVLYFVRL